MEKTKKKMAGWLKAVIALVVIGAIGTIGYFGATGGLFQGMSFDMNRFSVSKVSPTTTTVTKVVSSSTTGSNRIKVIYEFRPATYYSVQLGYGYSLGDNSFTLGITSDKEVTITKVRLDLKGTINKDQIGNVILRPSPYDNYFAYGVWKDTDTIEFDISAKPFKLPANSQKFMSIATNNFTFEQGVTKTLGYELNSISGLEGIVDIVKR